jgi:hypothetical protein
MSAEHVFSRGLSPTKNVFGFGFRHLGSGKMTSIDTLQVRNLCQGHNSDLSELDQSAIDVMNVAREVNGIAAARLDGRSTSRDRVAFLLDGRRFERWALKTTRNVYEADPTDWHWQPPSDFAQVVFGLTPLPVGCGLAFLDEVEDPFNASNGLACTYYRRPGSKEPSGSLLGFAGFLFLCTWGEPVDAVMPINSDTFKARVAVLNRVQVEIPGTNVWMNFDWTGARPWAEEQAVTALRAKYAQGSR